MIKRIIALLMCVSLSFLLISCSSGESKDKTEEKAQLVFDAVDCAYSSYDESTISAYSDLCRAVFSAETEVRVNVGMLSDIIQLFYTSFPLNVLVKDIKPKDDKSGLIITYKQSTEETANKAQDFADKVQEILKTCGFKKIPEAAFVINLYSYTASNINKSDKNGITAYDAIMTGEADALTAANMFEYLLRQGGVKSGHIISSDAVGAGWGVAIAEIGGVNYLFDPMTELLSNGGKQLCYFGMTTDDAKAEGLNGFTYTNMGDAPVCDNPFFDSCRSCTAWELSENNETLFVTRSDGEIIEIEL